MVKFFVAWAAVFSFTQQSQASHLEHQRQAVRREGVPQCGISYLNLGQVGHVVVKWKGNMKNITTI